MEDKEESSKIAYSLTATQTDQLQKSSEHISKPNAYKQAPQSRLRGVSVQLNAV